VVLRADEQEAHEQQGHAVARFVVGAGSRRFGADGQPGVSAATTSYVPARKTTVDPRANRPRRDAAVRTGAGVLLWSTLLLVTYWWAAGGGVQALAGREDGLTSLGRLTGLLAADLLLVQVLLMARVPVLEHAFGQDRLARQHRIVGFTSFTLMLGHVVLITWGYAAGALSRTPATLWQLTVDYPGMLLAVAGTACLVMVVVTSLRAARRRLRYESWHLLHLYAYLGVGLALPHQLWTGQEFLTSPAATVFWWGLWATAAGAVLVWRVGLPLWRSARHGLTVTSVVDEDDGVVSVHLTGRRMERLRAEAGQFFTWRFLSRPGWTRGNPYSLSAAPDGRGLRITVKELGDGSAALRDLRPGTRVLVEGPYGRLSARVRTRPKVALIAAGVGITPLRALAEELDYRRGDAILLYRFGDRPLFEAELAALSRERGLRLIWLPGHRRSPTSWLGHGVGRADDLTALTSWVPDIAERDVYVCGPESWAADVRRTTEAAGLPADRFHVESFGW
jgi:predicted ferric reductase